MARRACPTVTVQNVLIRPSPRLRATSSWAGSAPRRLAATGRKTNGYTARVMTSTAAQKPAMDGKMAFQPKLTTKSGMPSGITTRMARRRRHGTSVRSTNHAARVPTMALRIVTTTTNDTEFQINVAVRLRNNSWCNSSPSDLRRLDDEEDQRQQHGTRHEHRSGDEQGWQPAPAAAAARSRRALGHSS